LIEKGKEKGRRLKGKEKEKRRKKPQTI